MGDKVFIDTERGFALMANDKNTILITGHGGCRGGDRDFDYGGWGGGAALPLGFMESSSEPTLYSPAIATAYPMAAHPRLCEAGAVENCVSYTAL
jgi:hypothetical protein